MRDDVLDRSLIHTKPSTMVPIDRRSFIYMLILQFSCKSIQSLSCEQFVPLTLRFWSPSTAPCHPSTGGLLHAAYSRPASSRDFSPWEPLSSRRAPSREMVVEGHSPLLLTFSPRGFRGYFTVRPSAWLARRVKDHFT